jgi:hypothetical protein
MLLGLRFTFKQLALDSLNLDNRAKTGHARKQYQLKWSRSVILVLPMQC